MWLAIIPLAKSSSSPGHLYSLTFKLFGSKMPCGKERKLVLARLGQDLARIEKTLDENSSERTPFQTVANFRCTPIVAGSTETHRASFVACSLEYFVPLPHTGGNGHQFASSRGLAPLVPLADALSLAHARRPQHGAGFEY
jgi:hypothetical protein